MVFFCVTDQRTNDPQEVAVHTVEGCERACRTRMGCASFTLTDGRCVTYGPFRDSNQMYCTSSRISQHPVPVYALH